VAWPEVVVLRVWLGFATVEMVCVGWWRCTSGMFLKARCSGSSAMVGRFWVDN
jgi:hypothetical protein